MLEKIQKQNTVWKLLQFKALWFAYVVMSRGKCLSYKSTAGVRRILFTSSLLLAEHDACLKFEDCYFSQRWTNPALDTRPLMVFWCLHKNKAVIYNSYIPSLTFTLSEGRGRTAKRHRISMLFLLYSLVTSWSWQKEYPSKIVRS